VFQITARRWFLEGLNMQLANLLYKVVVLTADNLFLFNLQRSGMHKFKISL